MRDLIDFTKGTVIPEEDELTENEYLQLFGIMVNHETGMGSGQYEAINLAYKAGYQTGKDSLRG